MRDVGRQNSANKTSGDFLISGRRMMRMSITELYRERRGWRQRSAHSEESQLLHETQSARCVVCM